MADFGLSQKRRLGGGISLLWAAPELLRLAPPLATNKPPRHQHHTTITIIVTMTIITVRVGEGVGVGVVVVVVVMIEE